MPRPFFGKVHTSQCLQKRPSGITYVYDRTTRYDKDKQKTITVKTKLTGKILPDSDEIVPTRSKKPKGGIVMPVSAVRKHVGLTDILEWAGRASQIDNDVHSSLSEGDADKILSIARYWIGTNGNTLPRLQNWQIMHDLPYKYEISEDVYGKLFKSLGYNEDGIQRYFQARASRLDKSPVIAYDSTTISTYSVNQKEACQGFNKERDGMDTIKLLTLYSVKDREPIAFAKQPGNIPDVIAIANTIEQLKCFDIVKPMVTTDNGYYSLDNMRRFCQRNMKFLTLIDTDVNMARDAVDILQDQMNNMGAVCPFDLNVSGASMSKMYTFNWHRKRAGNGKKVGDTEILTRRLYFYVFQSNELVNKRSLTFRRKLLELKTQVEEGGIEFTEAAQRKIDKYLILSRLGRGGKLRVLFNEEECAKAKKYFGNFVLVSNCAMNVFEALTNYRLREKIEELFQDEKGSVDGRRIRTWHSDTLRGRQFVQFITLCYHCFLTKKIQDVKDGLCTGEENKTKKQMEMEKKLKIWLEQRSMVQIFDWYDCRETITVKTDAGSHRWTSESIARDRLFLERLGVTQ